MEALSKAERFRLGLTVFIALLIVTAIEYLIAVLIPHALTYLLVAALIKAGLIAYYFMHIAHLWHLEEE